LPFSRAPTINTGKYDQSISRWYALPTYAERADFVCHPLGRASVEFVLLSKPHEYWSLARSYNHLLKVQKGNVGPNDSQNKISDNWGGIGAGESLSLMDVYSGDHAAGSADLWYDQSLFEKSKR
jgi:hypothetical protein